MRGGEQTRRIRGQVNTRNRWQLCQLLCERLQANSKFVFVPGPLDPGGGGILPQPPLPAYFSERLAEELPSAVFASNPCRVSLTD